MLNTPNIPPLHGIVLFAHGSRDPQWRMPIEAVGQYIAAHPVDNNPQAQEKAQVKAPVLVCCAYLELCLPDLAQAAQQLIDQGASSITVVPMFLGTGQHARKDLPLLIDALRIQHPEVGFTVQQAIGEDPRMTALMADIARTPPYYTAKI